MAENRYIFTKVNSTVGPQAGGDPVHKCGALLENRMQCTRAGEFWVTDKENPEKKYQVCKRHAVVMESEGNNWSPKEEKEVVPSEQAPETSEPPVAQGEANSSDSQPTNITEKPKTVADILGQK